MGGVTSNNCHSCLMGEPGTMRILRSGPITQYCRSIMDQRVPWEASSFHLGSSCTLDSLLEPGLSILDNIGEGGGVAEILTAMWPCFTAWVSGGGEAWRGESNERELSLNQITESGKSQWIVIQRLLSHSQQPILYLSRLQRIELNQNKSNIIQQPVL